jgi:hypothetical protein
MRSSFAGVVLVSLSLALSLGCGGGGQSGGGGGDGGYDGPIGIGTPDGATASDDASSDVGTTDGSSIGDDTSIAFANYAMTPSNVVVKIDLATSTPGTQAFTVQRTNPDGSMSDVTASSTFTVDDTSLGSFSGNTFTSATSLPSGVLGKTTIVHAQPGGAEANLTVVALRTSGTSRDFFFTVPYMKDPDPKQDTLHFGTNIQQVDVAFLLDTTASMAPEIGNLGDSLADATSGILVKLTGAIPSVGVALAHFQDFPVDPVGTGPGHSIPASIPYVLDYPVQTGTIGLNKVRSQVYSLQAATSGGGLPSEAHYEAQHQLLTGAGFAWTIDDAKLPTGVCAGSCKGNSGSIAAVDATHPGVGFRTGSLPIVVQVTDAGWMTQANYQAWTGGQLSPATESDVVAAYAAAKAKFVAIQAIWTNASGGMATPCVKPADSSASSIQCDSAEGYQQAVSMAVQTGSYLDPSAFTHTAGGPCADATKCCTGVGGAAVDPYKASTAGGPGDGKCPLVFQAKTDGTGVADGVVSAITAIAVGASFDVTAVASNDPTNAPDATGKPVDATKFIQSIEALGAGTSDGTCAKLKTSDTNGDGVQDTFLSVNVHTPVCFIVHAATNTTVPATKDPQFFHAFIDVLGMPGSVKLDRRSVIFLVPPQDLAVK